MTEGGLERSLEKIGMKLRQTTAGDVAHAAQILTERGTHTNMMMKTDPASADEALLNPHHGPLPTPPAVPLKP